MHNSVVLGDKHYDKKIWRQGGRGEAGALSPEGKVRGVHPTGILPELEVLLV